MRNDKVFLDSNLSSLNVLIVEDDFFSALLIKKYLNSVNIITHHVTNGIDAVKYCKKKSINLVLMDIKLPGINGIEATKQIKSNNPTLTVIAQTACAVDFEIKKILNSKFDAYISKPFRKDDLINVVMRNTLALSC